MGFDKLEIYAGLGVYDEEQGQSRYYYLDGRFTYNAKLARTSGALVHALDYAAIAQGWKALAESRHYGLLEELAGDLLDQVYASQILLEGCTLKICKPNAVAPGCHSILEIRSERRGASWTSIS